MWTLHILKFCNIITIITKTPIFLIPFIFTLFLFTLITWCYKRGCVLFLLYLTFSIAPSSFFVTTLGNLAQSSSLPPSVSCESPVCEPDRPHPLHEDDTQRVRGGFARSCVQEQVPWALLWAQGWKPAGEGRLGAARHSPSLVGQLHI